MDECKFGGWGYEEESDVAVEGGVVFRGCGGAVEEQGEGREVENDAVEGRLREKRNVGI